MTDISVVRLSTESFKRGNRYYRSRVISPLSSKSTFDLMHEEASSIGVDEAFDNIVNLDKCEDGLYILTTCNVYYDIESGHMDDWELKLIPYEG